MDKIKELKAEAYDAIRQYEHFNKAAQECLAKAQQLSKEIAEIENQQAALKAKEAKT